MNSTFVTDFHTKYGIYQFFVEYNSDESTEKKEERWNDDKNEEVAWNRDNPSAIDKKVSPTCGIVVIRDDDYVPHLVLRGANRFETHIRKSQRYGTLVQVQKGKKSKPYSKNLWNCTFVKVSMHLIKSTCLFEVSKVYKMNSCL